ncbi:MAG: hypothetical protein EBR82_15310 [Caulobacteraceae bacterium]|nr:hypothetical protein [Caulobacteraceae bacterium]
MIAPLSQPAAQFLALLQKGKPVTLQTAQEYGVLSPAKAALELLNAGYAVRGGFSGKVMAVVWTITKQPKPVRKGGVQKSEKTAVREAKIEALMADGQWRTIHEIGCGIGCVQSDIRVRDALARFRTQPDLYEFGKRKCRDRVSGHWEFRIVRRAT